VDVLEAKRRIAAALVESVFRRARYEIRPGPAAAGGARSSREAFDPDFVARSPGDGPSKEFAIEVQHHPHVGQFLSMDSHRGERSRLAMAKRRWPDLYVVFVNDGPAPGRSASRALSLAAWEAGGQRNAGSGRGGGLGIFPHNVSDHEELVRRIFGLLGGVSRMNRARSRETLNAHYGRSGLGAVLLAGLRAAGRTSTPSRRPIWRRRISSTRAGGTPRRAGRPGRTRAGQRCWMLESGLGGPRARWPPSVAVM
jgi:hypothetical protein